MLNIKQLLNLTPAKVRYRSSYPRIRVIEDKPRSKYRHIYTRVSLGNVESTGDSYTQTIRCHGTKKNSGDFILSPDSLLWVHCSCPYFTYYLETVLHLHGSSRIYNSNGGMPRITNPKLRPYLCKHLYATTLDLLAKDKKKIRKR